MSSMFIPDTIAIRTTVYSTAITRVSFSYDYEIEFAPGPRKTSSRQRNGLQNFTTVYYIYILRTGKSLLQQTLKIHY